MTPPPIERSRLYVLQFLNSVFITTFGFAFLVALGFVVFDDRGSGLTSLVLFAYGALLWFARRQLQHGRVQRSVLLMCLGLLAATVAVAAVQPIWVFALLLTPLIAITVALPYTSTRTIKYLTVTSWIVVIFVAIFGELNLISSTLPTWLIQFFRVSGVATVFAVVLLLQWQFSSRLSDTLAQTQAAEERYALAMQGANDGLWDWDLQSGRVYFSPRWKAMVGLSETANHAEPEMWFERLHPEDKARVKEQIQAHLEGRTPFLESEYRLCHEDGAYRWMLSRGLAVRNLDGVPTRMAGSQTDISERKAIEQQLLHAAYHDALTHLPNRAFFIDRLSRSMARAGRDPSNHFAVLFLDLDRFKVLNDSRGHQAGDQLLVAVAARLQECVRPYDTVARLGGDEFTLLLTDLAHPRDALIVAERTLVALSDPFQLEGGEVYATASIGIVLSSADYAEPSAYLRDADIALYRAKTLGRARYAIFDQAMHREVLAMAQMEDDLRRAIEREELGVVYQPIVALTSGRITGFEALVRWHHPEQGMISPVEFIPLAEETGLIHPLSWWVLREACCQLGRWQQEVDVPLTINVNWSRRLFNREGLVEQVGTILEETETDPWCLRLEITESVLSDEAADSAQLMAKLRALDIQLQIDDFGTEYSSLSTLHTWPINALKIDRSFINRLGDDDDTGQIVQAIITLAHHLGMDVIAEGVETAQQLAELRALGCDYGQGYYFSRPLDSRKASALLETERQW
jgi:diguanylate cyclase (GGDEF)-like protein/PAS domain S-box-containing protein